uniref:Transthyretin-like family protein n=1 Tax=Angiostrongylus cantonensis TaxID=6313 RepID=A0A158PCC1_ANGCA
MLKLIVTCLLVHTVLSLGIGRTQSSGVKGRLICDGKPAVGVTVKLYDDDRGVDADDLMASGKTNSNGEFELRGYTEEFTPIDPKLNIYHDCNDFKPCQRKFTIKLPDKYITNGKIPRAIYDAGTIQLSGAFPGEERDCFH